MEAPRKVHYSEWMEDSGDDLQDWGAVFHKDKFDQGGKGHMLLQLQKSYRGDDRFRLDQDEFVVNPDKDRGFGKASLPDTMLGALSKREREALNLAGKKRKRSDEIKTETVADDLDTGLIQWDAELDMEKEKARLFGVLGKIVPQTEVFFQDHKSSKQHLARKADASESVKVAGKAIQQIRRFDPRNPQSQALIVSEHSLTAPRNRSKKSN